MQIEVWISLTVYFAAMLGIGIYGWRKSTSSNEEYMLGGRDLPPAVAALSAGASDMSGWLLLGASRRIASAIIIVVFFAVYTASGLVAGGKLFSTAFDGSYQMGVWLTLGIVLAYTVVGGFLAVCLTDFVQGLIMMLVLIIMPAIVLYAGDGGGFGQAGETLSGAEGFTLSWWTDTMKFIGWLGDLP